MSGVTTVLNSLKDACETAGLEYLDSNTRNDGRFKVWQESAEIQYDTGENTTRIGQFVIEIYEERKVADKYETIKDASELAETIAAYVYDTSNYSAKTCVVTEPQWDFANDEKFRVITLTLTITYEV